MTEPEHILVFRLESAADTPYALPLANVERVLPSVAIRPVATVPAELRGLINVAGQIVPVLDLCTWFGLPVRTQELTDRIILVRVSGVPLAFLVAEVIGVRLLDAARYVQSGDLLAGLDEWVQGVLVLEDGMILVYNLDKLLAHRTAGITAAVQREAG